MKEENNNEKKNGLIDSLLANKNALIVVGIVIVFAIAFFAFQTIFKTQPKVYNNITSEQSFSFEKLSSILTPKNISVQLNVESVDQKVFGLAVGSPEVASAIAGFGKNVSTQGKISDYCINSNQTRIECRNPQVILEIGPCNCMKIVGDSWVIQGTNEFFVANSANLRGIVRKAIGG